MDIQKRNKGKRIHSRNNIDSAASALVTITKEKKVTFKSEQAIKEIKKNVLAARKNGSTWAEIADIVQSAGLDVALSTLRKICRDDVPKATPTPTKAGATPPTPKATTSGGSLGDRLRAERATPPPTTPVQQGVAATSQVKKDGRGGFAITPMIDDI